jgi:GTP-binding protein YchF
MQIGLFGFQFSGKTTLFQTLLNSAGTLHSFEHHDQDRASIPIPDHRLNELTKMYNPKKQVNAALEILDLPGLRLSDDGKIKITSEFINRVKNTSALIHIVRCFENEVYPHPESSIDPARDIDFFETEFILSDMELIERRLEKIEKEITKSKNEQLARELPVFKKLQHHIEKELPLRQLHLDENEKKTISGYQFLSIKPVIIGLNFDESSKDQAADIIKQVESHFAGKDIHVVPFYAQFEFELSQLSDEEAELFKSDFGITQSALQRLLRTTYDHLHLQSFFTVGEDECRAWTIRKGMNAQESAGVIHSDFFQKFIRAEVVHYDDQMKYQTIAKCKEAGVWRVEGRDYIVLDGDILNIRHS